MRASNDNMLYNETAYKRYCKDCDNYIPEYKQLDVYYCRILNRKIKNPMCGFCSWFKAKGGEKWQHTQN